VNCRGIGLGEFHVKLGMGQRCCLFDGFIELASRGKFLDRRGSCTGIYLFCIGSWMTWGIRGIDFLIL